MFLMIELLPGGIKPASKLAAILSMLAISPTMAKPAQTRLDSDRGKEPGRNKNIVC